MKDTNGVVQANGDQFAPIWSVAQEGRAGRVCGWNGKISRWFSIETKSTYGQEALVVSDCRP